MPKHSLPSPKLFVWTLLAGLVSLSLITPATAQPATAPAADELVKIKVVEVVRLVRVRQSEDQPYQVAKVGMEFDEGAEFQTGTGARVRVAIPPDQTITIDRLTTCKVIRARVGGGGQVARTDLGMQYGRTQYSVEAAGVEHESSIRSPGATLAVRGTRFMELYDHGPFVPYAVAAQPVEFRNLRRQVIAFGEDGRTAGMSGEDNSPGETAMTTTAGTVVPTVSQTRTENYALRFLSAFNFGNPGAAVFKEPLSLGVTFPLDRQLQFQLRWFNVPFADVDFSVVDPGGQVVSIKNLTSPSGGRFAGANNKGGNGVASKSGFGVEGIEWPNGFPTGNFTLRAQARGPIKGQIDLQFNVIQTDPSNEARKPVILVLTGQLNPRTGTATKTVFADTDVLREQNTPTAKSRANTAKAKGGRPRETKPAPKAAPKVDRNRGVTKRR